MKTTVTKTYVQPDNTALWVCPECGFQKSIPINRYRHKKHQIKIRCKCNTQFNLFLEFRRFFRKDVNLDGECTILPGDGESKKVILTDLSMGGMCIQVGCAELCTEGVRGITMFTLDDRHKTEIIKKFVVKSIIGNRVHCEFFKDLEYQKELGFYLRK